MAKDKTKPVAYFQKLLAIDCETTGICFHSDSPVSNPTTGEIHQTVSWGLIVADAVTFEPVEQLYVEIKWNDTSRAARNKNPNFGLKAEQVHGLTFNHLEQHGITEEEAVIKIGNLILKHWSPKVSIKTLGCNITTFDIPFLRDLFRRHGIELNFGSRHYDTNSLSLGTVGAYDSNDLFESLGFEKRKEHNSLDDARLALESFKSISTLWRSLVKIKAYKK